MEPVVSKHIDSINRNREEETKKKIAQGEEPYKYFDSTIWRRSCTKEASSPLHGEKKGKLN